MQKGQCILSNGLCKSTGRVNTVERDAQYDGFYYPMKECDPAGDCILHSMKNMLDISPTASKLCP